MEVGSVVMNCRNVNALLKKKLYQQFRLKKPGGAGVKLFQAILVVNRDPGGTPVTLPMVERVLNFVWKCYIIRNGRSLWVNQMKLK